MLPKHIAEGLVVGSVWLLTLSSCGDGESGNGHTTSYPARDQVGGVIVMGRLNACPTVDPLTVAPTEVKVGSSIPLTVGATDPDDAPLPLRVEWYSSDGWVAKGKNVWFPCISVGDFRVLAVVSDGDSTCDANGDEGGLDVTTSVVLRCSDPSRN